MRTEVLVEQRTKHMRRGAVMMLRPFAIFVALCYFHVSLPAFCLAESDNEFSTKSNSDLNAKKNDEFVGVDVNGTETVTKTIENAASLIAEGSIAISLGNNSTEESYLKRRRAMRQTWAKTFNEIKALVRKNTRSMKTGETQTSIKRTKELSPPLLNQWKLLVDTSPKKRDLSAQSYLEDGNRALKLSFKVDRFKGYANWERRLEQWEEEVIQYLEKRVLLDSGEDNTANVKVKSNKATIQNKDDALPTDKKKSKSQPPLYDFKLSFPVVPTPAKPDEPVVPITDISDKSKNIWIVTTAALPWMTGTAVNPLLRSAYMTRGRKKAGGSVTLLIPWLERDDDQETVYGQAKRFPTQKDQEEYIRTWLHESANMPQESEELNIAWYTAWQVKAENSIYSMGDITALIPTEEADICVLEEPEHLNWYRAPGENWTDKFKHVVGIVHTNYFVYAQDQPAALVRAPGMRLLCSWMCRAHCHRLIKLSGTLDNFAPEKELVENVHGVRRSFLDIGEKVHTRLAPGPLGLASDPVFGADADPKVYFIGKMLWSKGMGSLMELMKYAEESADLSLKIDMYGGGPNKDDASKRATKMGLDMEFHGAKDHALLGETYKIFVNPSTSEVLCTTSAEALAMGKFVILPSHPSNDFFAQFPNCLPYTTKEEFVANLYYATTHSPEPLSEEYAYALSWEAATERFEAAACISVAESEELKKAFSENEVGIDIDLPPIIEDDLRRNRIVATLELTRERYRLFRENLKDEIRQQKFLPDDVQERMVSELEKRFEIDFEEFLGSPKVRLRLSPAELDRQLLDLHNSVSRSPSGGLLRMIGGGEFVGAQNYYLKQQALKQMQLNSFAAPLETSEIVTSKEVSLSPSYLLESGDPLSLTSSIRKVLQKNNLRQGMSTKASASLQKKKDDHDASVVGSRTKQKDGLSSITPSLCCGRIDSWTPSSRPGVQLRPSSFSPVPVSLCPKLITRRI
jgi:digalactosyldiacylglycerol synthase